MKSASRNGGLRRCAKSWRDAVSRGILELSERGNASWAIGVLAAITVLSKQELQELLRLALVPIIAGKEEVHSYKNLIAGAVRALADDDEARSGS